MSTAIRRSPTLETSDPSLYLRWLRYKGAQDRLAWWAKTSGRYTRTNNEPNTYILFTELAAELAGARGSVGLIVKTGLRRRRGAVRDLATTRQGRDAFAKFEIL